MKKYLTTLCIVLFTSYASNAEDVTSEALHVLSEKVSEFTSNLIPGEGYTEASIDFREDHEPNFSILGVREIAPIEDGKFFTQFSLFSTESADSVLNNENCVKNFPSSIGAISLTPRMLKLGSWSSLKSILASV